MSALVVKPNELSIVRNAFQMIVRSKHKRIETRRKAPGVGVYAGQISNFDSIQKDFFPLTVPNIPLTPEGTDYKPSKLFMIWRVKDTKGRPYWEKDIMRSLGLESRKYDIQIIKNSPTSNQMLYHVKHLIRIKPITFPNGIPTEEDIGNTMLKPNGELIIRKTLRIDSKDLTEEQKLDTKKFDSVTLGKHLRLRWLNSYDV